MHPCELGDGLCQHGGVCVELAAEGGGAVPFACQCAGNFGGGRCETDLCAGVDCGGHGECAAGACVCDEGFDGDRCAHRVVHNFASSALMNADMREQLAGWLEASRWLFAGGPYTSITKDSASFTLPDSFSVHASIVTGSSIRPTYNQAGGGILMLGGDGGVWCGNLYVWINSHCTFSFGVQCNGHSDVPVTSTSIVAPSTAYTLRCDYDGTTASMYVNGVLEARVAKAWNYPTAINAIQIGSGAIDSSENEPYDFGTITNVTIGQLAPGGWALCYSSPNGDPKTSPEEFHRRCDAHERTVSVVRNSLGYTFGGYAQVSWAGDAYITSGNEANFLFQLAPRMEAYPPLIDARQQSFANEWPTWGHGSCLSLGCPDSACGQDYTTGQMVLGANGHCQANPSCPGTPDDFCGGDCDWGETELEVWYALKDLAALPAWDSGDLRSTGNPAGAAFTLYKLPAVDGWGDAGKDAADYTAACAEYGLQGIGCFSFDSAWPDLTEFHPPGMHMPREFGCELYSGSHHWGADGGGDPARDLGSSTGWTDLLFYDGDSGTINGMAADGEGWNGHVDKPRSPVCARVMVPPVLGVSMEEFRAGLAMGAYIGAEFCPPAQPYSYYNSMACCSTLPGPNPALDMQCPGIFVWCDGSSDGSRFQPTDNGPRCGSSPSIIQHSTSMEGLDQWAQSGSSDVMVVSLANDVTAAVGTPCGPGCSPTVNIRTGQLFLSCTKSTTPCEMRDRLAVGMTLSDAQAGADTEAYTTLRKLRFVGLTSSMGTSTQSGDDVFRGGAIYLGSGSLTVIECQFEHNSAVRQTSACVGSRQNRPHELQRKISDTTLLCAGVGWCHLCSRPIFPTKLFPRHSYINGSYCPSQQLRVQLCTGALLPSFSSSSIRFAVVAVLTVPPRFSFDSSPWHWLSHRCIRTVGMPSTSILVQLCSYLEAPSNRTIFVACLGSTRTTVLSSTEITTEGDNNGAVVQELRLVAQLIKKWVEESSICEIHTHTHTVT